MENLESHGMQEFHFPGLESHGILFLVIESHGNLIFLFATLVTANDKARTV